MTYSRLKNEEIDMTFPPEKVEDPVDGVAQILNAKTGDKMGNGEVGWRDGTSR